MKTASMIAVWKKLKRGYVIKSMEQEETNQLQNVTTGRLLNELYVRHVGEDVIGYINKGNLILIIREKYTIIVLLYLIITFFLSLYSIYSFNLVKYLMFFVSTKTLVPL